MKNPRLIFWLGIIAIVLPLLGIPETWKHLILFIVGLTLIAMSLVGRNQGAESVVSEKVFADNESELMREFEDVARRTSEEQGYTSKYAGPAVVSEDVSHTRMTNQYDLGEDEPSVQLVYADDSFDASDVRRTQDARTAAATDIYGFSDTVVQDIVPPKKPRKKRVSKKATVQNEMENPVLVSSDVEDIINDIEETFDARN
jgi:hypothetical protein